MKLAVGQEIAGHRIVRQLGQGGYGAVYEAQQEHPRRRVAIKVPWWDRPLDEAAAAKLWTVSQEKTSLSWSP